MKLTIKTIPVFTEENRFWVTRNNLHFRRHKVSKEEKFAIPNVATPNQPVLFNEDVCTGCNLCVEVCQMDVFIPHPQNGKPPIILHPEECWYGGCCANDCPVPGAIQFNWPLALRGYWKNKETGKVYQL
jgi:NAD-dependent dihydropyrimidine dehydrogenase PreA subunit